jgi:hypothetical protein
MFAGSKEGVGRYPNIGLPLTLVEHELYGKPVPLFRIMLTEAKACAGRPKRRPTKGEHDASTISASLLRNSGADLDLQPCLGQERRSKSQELSDGATMSLEEL